MTSFSPRDVQQIAMFTYLFPTDKHYFKSSISQSHKCHKQRTQFNKRTPQMQKYEQRKLETVPLTNKTKTFRATGCLKNVHFLPFK